MADIRRIPFTEMVERVQKELVRDNSAAEGKYQGRVNDEYQTAIPAEIDYRHIKKTGNITTWEDYNTGAVAVTSGSTTVTGTNTAWDTGANANWVAGTDSMLIKLGNYNEVYRATYVSATECTLDRNWVESTDTSETYRLYQDRFALPTDFDRMVKDPDQCVYYWRYGYKVYLTYKDLGEFQLKQTSTPGWPDVYTVEWVNDDPYIFISLASDTPRTVSFDYMPALSRMTEYTTGTITTLDNGSTAVTGNGTDFDSYVTTAKLLTNTFYFRLDRDGTGGSSQWYKVSSATTGTALVLSDVYEGVAVSTATLSYTICNTSLLPRGLDVAITYGAALKSAVDQDSTTQTKSWGVIHRDAVDKYKKVETDRGYGKQRMRTIYEKTGVRR